VREQDRQPPAQTKRDAVLLGLALMVYLTLTGVCLSLVPVIKPQMQDQFGLSSSQIGLLTGMFMLSTSLGAIPMGLAGARWGGRVLVFGGGLFIVGLILFAATASYPWFLVARLIQGIGASAGPPVGTAVIAQSLDRRYHGWAFGAFGMGQGVGVLLTLLIMPSVQAAGGYRAVSLAAAGVTFLLVLVSLGRRELRALPQSPAPSVAVRELLRSLGAIALNYRFLLLVIVNIGVIGLFVGIVAWTPAFLHDQRGMSLAAAAYLTAGLGLAQLLGSPAGATIMAHLGKVRTIVLDLSIMLVATALVPFAPGVGGVIVCVVITGFLTLANLPAFLGLVPEVFSRRPDQIGPATGYMYTVNLVATMLAPWLFGVLLDRYGIAKGDKGYLLGYELLAFLAFLGLVAALLFVFGRKGAAGETAPEPPVREVAER